MRGGCALWLSQQEEATAFNTNAQCYTCGQNEVKLGRTLQELALLKSNSSLKCMYEQTTHNDGAQILWRPGARQLISSINSDALPPKIYTAAWKVCGAVLNPKLPNRLATIVSSQPGARQRIPEHDFMKLPTGACFEVNLLQFCKLAPKKSPTPCLKVSKDSHIVVLATPKTALANWPWCLSFFWIAWAVRDQLGASDSTV